MIATTSRRYRITGSPESYCFALQVFEHTTAQGEYWRVLDMSKDRSFLEDRKDFCEGKITEREFAKRNLARRKAGGRP